MDVRDAADGLISGTENGKCAAIFTSMYHRFANELPRFTPYSLEALKSNSNISRAKATDELGYKPHPLYESIHAVVMWFLDNNKKKGRKK